MARNFTGTATTVATTLTFTGGLVKKAYIKNSGTQDLLANVPAVHGDDDFDTIAPGEVGEYESDNNIRTMKVKTASSTTTYTAGALAGSADGVAVPEGLGIVGKFESGCTTSVLNVSFDGDAPAAAAMDGMMLVPLSGLGTGRPIKVKSAVNNGDSTFTLTPQPSLEAGTVPVADDRFAMGLVGELLTEATG